MKRQILVSLSVVALTALATFFLGTTGLQTAYRYDVESIFFAVLAVFLLLFIVFAYLPKRR